MNGVSVNSGLECFDHRKHAPEGSWSAIVKDVDGELLHLERVEESSGGHGQRLERVRVVAGLRNHSEPVAREVGRDDPVLLGKDGNEVTVLERGGGEAVQEQDDGECSNGGGGSSVGWVRLAVEDFDSVVDDDGLGLGECGHHERTLSAASVFAVRLVWSSMAVWLMYCLAYASIPLADQPIDDNGHVGMVPLKITHQ